MRKTSFCISPTPTRVSTATEDDPLAFYAAKNKEFKHK